MTREERDTDRASAAVFDPESGAQVVRVARLVREALEGFASEETVDDILRRAMSDSGRDELPRTSSDLDAFVSDHLARDVEARLGAEAAEALRARLAPSILAMERMEETRRASTLPPPPGAAEPEAERRFSAIVLAGSPQDASRLAQRVGSPVRRAADAAAFVSAVAGCGGAPAMVVVDCRFQNPITSAGLRVLERSALDGAVVVLWGGNPLVEREWRRRSPGAVVLRTDVASDVEDLAALIRLGPE